MIVMCSRVIVGILDAFHFDLRNSQHAVVNLPDAIAKKKAKGEITGMGLISMRKKKMIKYIKLFYEFFISIFIIHQDLLKLMQVL